MGVPRFSFTVGVELASVQAFFVVDILQFAGLSFMLIAALKKLGLSNIAVFAVSIVMVVIDRFIMLPDTVSWIAISVLIHAQSVFNRQFGTLTTIGVMVFLIIGCTWITKLRTCPNMPTWLRQWKI